MPKDTFEQMPDMSVSRGNSPKMEDMRVPNALGSTALCRHVPELKTAHMIVGDKGEDPYALVLVIATDYLNGVFVTLPPQAAREVAQALLRSADAAEQMYGARAQ